ncbi:polyamine aminopropyltransferase [Marinicella sp. S1101]|nr:polyamine aminopropyltransferase [Marinicella marina]MCX7552332.1 polyamine aminopropyltransferase [Marinicella marina]
MKIERLYPSWGQAFSPEKVLFEHQTEHQHLVIFKNQQWGKVMMLDGVVQTTEKDEFIYHEMMTHVPMFSHHNPQKVLIIGGGDGGILREVLKHQSVKHVTQVEIDQAVIDMCIKYLPNHSAGAFTDERVDVVIDDGVNYVSRCSQKFDVIISDSTDPIGPGESLFTSEFYHGVQSCLADDGVFVAQNGVSFMQLDEVITTHKRLSPCFKDVGFYAAAVPTYVGGIMTFAWASQNPTLRQFDLSQLEHKIQQAAIKTQYHTAAIHQASFALPRYILTALGTSV